MDTKKAGYRRVLRELSNDANLHSHLAEGLSDTELVFLLNERADEFGARRLPGMRRLLRMAAARIEQLRVR